MPELGTSGSFANMGLSLLSSWEGDDDWQLGFLKIFESRANTEESRGRGSRNVDEERLLLVAVGVPSFPSFRGCAAGCASLRSATARRRLASAGRRASRVSGRSRGEGGTEKAPGIHQICAGGVTGRCGDAVALPAPPGRGDALMTVAPNRKTSVPPREDPAPPSDLGGGLLHDPRFQTGARDVSGQN